MKILMVCLGNICRSPLAHGIMEHLAKERGLNWEIDSAGTGSWHIGQPPDHRAVSIAKKYGLDISNQRCRQFSVIDLDSYDQIFVMDETNLNDVLKQARNDQDTTKVKLLLDQQIVPDPYHDDELFDPVYRMIAAGCKAIIEWELKHKQKSKP